MTMTPNNLLDKNIPVATRLSAHAIAKARDGLIAVGYDATALMTPASILRHTFLFGLAQMFGTQSALIESPSDESISIIKKKRGQTHERS